MHVGWMKNVWASREVGCCDQICIMDFVFKLYPVCLFIIVSLNAFEVFLMFFLHFVLINQP